SVRYIGEDFGLEVGLDRRSAALVAVGVSPVGEGDVLGVSLLRVRFGVAFAVSDWAAVLVEQWTFDGDGPVAEVVGGEHFRVVGVGFVEGVVEGEDLVAGG